MRQFYHTTGYSRQGAPVGRIKNLRLNITHAISKWLGKPKYRRFKD